MLNYGNYRLRKYDEHNIVIEEFVTREVPKNWQEKRGMKPTTSKWVIKGYFTSLEVALKKLLDISILNGSGADVSKLIETIKDEGARMVETIKETDLNTFKGKGTRLLKVS